MAADNYQPLLELGPFVGLDTTTADLEVKPGYAVAAVNANPTIVPGALMPERGRLPMVNFDAFFREILSATICVGPVDTPLYVVQGQVGTDVITLAYTPGSGITTIASGVKYDQAVQYGEVLYTNAGQRLFLNYLTTNPAFFDWQYQPPPVYDGTLSATTGVLSAGTFYYIFTRYTTMPDTSVSETSVNLDEFATGMPNITLTGNQSVNITVGSTFKATGTNDDGTTFFTKIYRQSTNNPGYIFVGDWLTNTTFNDNLPYPQALAQQAVSLEVNRDPPPMTLNNATKGTNLAALEIHKNRIWAFADVEDADNNNLVSNQLWYSNVDRPWEFDQTEQVLLLQSDVVSAEGFDVGPNYQAVYGNEPIGLAEIGTVLLAFKHRETWGVYGDSSINFVQRQLFGIGASARHSIVQALGGAIWLTDSGEVYWFDGSAPQFNSQDIQASLRPISGGPVVAPTDLIAACGCFSNDTYYLCFPTLGYSYGYNIIRKAWTSQLPYAPLSAATMSYVAANPSSYGGVGQNEVIAARAENPAWLDWWFGSLNADKGNAATYSWTGPQSIAPSVSEKQYRYAVLLVPPGTQGSAVVTLQVDQLPPWVWTIPDLSVGAQNLRTSIGYNGGDLRGFIAQLSVQVTVAGTNPAPQLWNVAIYGQVPPDRNFALRT